MQLGQRELSSDQLDPETLELAVGQVRNNGYALFERVLPFDLVAEMNASFNRLLDARRSQVAANRGANRWQMHLPFAPPFSDERVIASPLVMPIIDALVGEDCICHYLASDTLLPGSDYQEVHPDIFPLFPESDRVLPPYSVVLNVPLVDATEENGPLEIWPGGTHHYVTDRSDVPRLAASMQSQRVLMRAGSLLIRDSRMWHRGTPNRSNAPRPNFTLIYSRYWLRLRYRPIPIPRSAYESLSERGRRLFRLEDIGGGDGLADLEPDRFYATASC
jgi:ectoine hydroxylase-related dioxygenase (phytanoyl-CoA dioxygenase family)